MINLGVIGFSEGNGHPFSWSAIFNGYDYQSMLGCGYPVIPEYLSSQSFPSDFLCDIGKVTHVYSQDTSLSEKVRKASLVGNIVHKPEQLIGSVDAILLARDDAENHLAMAKPFIEAGLPIFIDKPLALSIRHAHEMLKMQKFETQIYSCSSLRYAKELELSKEEKQEIGRIRYIEAAVPKYWNTYAVHVIEPILVNCNGRGLLKEVKAVKKKGVQQTLIEWENLTAYIKCSGSLPTKLELTFFGEKQNITKSFHDSFGCFRASLANFILQITEKKLKIPREETLEIVQIIENGIV